jgi:hypothetical protein
LDRTGDLRICPIHKQPLVEEVQEGFYGTFSYIPEYLMAREELFPYASSPPYPSVFHHKWVRVSYCPECRRVKTAWYERRDAQRAAFEAAFYAAMQQAKDAGGSSAVVSLLAAKLKEDDHDVHILCLRTCFEIASMRKKGYGSIRLTSLIGRSRNHELQDAVSQRFDEPAMAIDPPVTAASVQAGSTAH